MKKLILPIIIFVFSANSFAQVPSYVDTNGLVSWWSFTGNANDNSGHGNNGVVTGATLSTDRFGSPNCAYYFDGASYILTSDTTNAPLGNQPRSFSCWINTIYPTLTGFGEIAFGWGSNITSGARFQFSIYHDMPYFVGEYADMWGTINVTDSLWHNIIVTYDGDTVKMYIDGIFDIASSQTLNTIGQQFKFGDIVDSHDDYFTGLLDDAGVWNRVISQCEIQNIYLSRTSKIINQPLNDTVLASSSCVYSITDTGGSATYQWQVDTGSGFVNIAGSSPYFGVTTKNLTINPASPLMNNYHYRCFRIDSISCIDTSHSALLVVRPELVYQPKNTGDLLNIFPNPSNNVVTIQLEKSTPIGSIQFTNQLGQVILEKNIDAPSTQLDMSDFPKGVYFLRIYSNGQYIYNKILRD